jgi:colanic acid/amylovoran biosynthesis glycosyltransferase
MSLRIAVFCDRFPELSETFVVNELRALRRAGHEVSVVASNRAERPADVTDLDVPVDYLIDDSAASRVRALVREIARHPLRAARDVRASRRWRPAERPRRLAGIALAAQRLRARGVDHVHAHFASRAATDALRAAALLDASTSVTAHAYDVFSEPANLELKLRTADFTTTGCDYNVDHLRGLLPAECADRVHRIVMGVDPAYFKRSRRYSGGGRVVAIGRLVEKKGFADLIEAIGLVRRRDLLERVTIVGDGPLESDLRERIARLGLGDVV